MVRRRIKKNKFRVGEWAFIAGVLIAILTGAFGITLEAGTVASILVILGIIVGFLNITKREMTDFLVAALALLLAGSAGLEKLPLIGGIIGPILLNIATFVAPAVIIVALKAIYELAKKK